MKIAYTAADGSAHVVHPNLEQTTLEEWLEANQHVIPNDARDVILTPDTPEDRGDRHMWAIQDGKLVVRGAAVPPALPADLPKTEVSEEPIEMPRFMRPADDERLPEEVTQASVVPEQVQVEPEQVQVTPVRIELPRIPSRQLPEMPQPIIEQAVTDDHRRESGLHIIDSTIERMASANLPAQVRYEVALQARNGNFNAISMLSEEATILGTKVDDLAAHIIFERTIYEQRIMRAFTERARAIKAIQGLTGPLIDEACRVAVDEIKRA
jgi:hypothetical protein